MVVVSAPLQELVGHGANAKAVKDCTELFLGERGIDQLGGFSSLVNLEVLWVNGNKLKAITHLDNNRRMKELYAQDNHICTLKGSLLGFKFLETLDMSNNELRDLEKLLRQLQHLGYLKTLNLKGNPCCEEPDYRLLVIYSLPWLHVLDQHVITGAERQRAKLLFGGDATASTVGFGTHIPAFERQEPVDERSVLEHSLAREVAVIRERQAEESEAAVKVLFANNPSASYYAPRPTLPPPAGIVKAQQAWATSTASSPHSTATLAATQPGAPGHTQGHWQTRGHSASAAGPSSSYVPKDVLVLSGLRQKGQTQALNGTQLLNTITSTGTVLEHASHFTTFRHHMTDNRWDACRSMVKL